MTARLSKMVVGIGVLLTLPGAAAVDRPQAETRLEEGKKFYAQEDYQRAVEAFEEAVKHAPNVSQYHVWLGRAYGRRAENTSKWKFVTALSLAGKARESFERAVELDKTNKDALQSLFDFYLEAPGMAGGGLDKAEKLAAQIEQVSAAEGARARAAIHEKRQQYDRAEQKLREAVRLEPGNAGHVLSLASFLSRRGRYEESDKLYEQAFRLAPDSPDVWYSRAKALLRSNRKPDEARRLLNRYLAAELPADAEPRSQAQELLKQI